MTHIIHRIPGRAPPRAVRASGSTVVDAEGRSYLDASGGAAVSCIGHAHPEVIAAIRAQLDAVEYAHTCFFTSAPAEELAALLAGQSPAELQHVYFVSGGSEAVESALKMARNYFVACGQPSKSRFISRLQSYHGSTLGALSLGGHMGRRELFEPLLTPCYHVSPCFALRHRAANESDDAFGTRLADELERTILSLGAENVAAFVAETVVGATTGAVAAVPGYFRKIRAVCDRHDVLLILDEVMCGTGRTGSYHAFEQESIVPDMFTLAKGLGGGYQPIGAVVASRRIAEALEDAGGFRHGFTYAGHPTAAAAALAVQKIIRREALVQRCADSGHLLAQLLRERLRDHPHVGDIRGRGLLQALELVRDRGSLEPFEPALNVHATIRRVGQRNGLLCYPAGGTVDGRRGDHVLLAPSFLTTRAELETIVDLLAVTIDEVTAQALAAS